MEKQRGGHEEERPAVGGRVHRQDVQLLVEPVLQVLLQNRRYSDAFLRAHCCSVSVQLG